LQKACLDGISIHPKPNQVLAYEMNAVAGTGGVEASPAYGGFQDAALLELDTTAMLADCVKNVTAIFPNICPDYVTKLAGENGYSTPAVIDALLELQEKSSAYPQKSLSPNPRKRKRADDFVLDLLTKPLGDVSAADVETLQNHFNSVEWRNCTIPFTAYRKLRYVHLSLLAMPFYAFRRLDLMAFQ